MTHWAAAYIGTPWSATGEGPESYHCWAFVRHVQAVRFGRTLPAIPNPEDLLAQARVFRAHPERARWRRVERPEEGDCVLLRRARYPVHVGVWIAIDGGGVLHCSQDSGVVFQRPPALGLNGWIIEGVYRFAGGDA
jgi:cell wall-associated NlpC family hydrolase